jgi:predicted ArsR family transcriptional regulator
MDDPDRHHDPLRIATLYTHILLELSQHPTLSQERLARQVDVTMRTAQRHLLHLEDEGYLQVDRGKRPYRYIIDWSRPLPTLPDLRLVLFHPAVVPLLHRLSEAAAQEYDHAVQEQQNPAERLRSLVAVGQPPEGVSQ